MDILQTIMSATGSGAMAEIARKVGLSEADAAAVLGKIAPALGRGVAGNAASANGLSGLLDALKSGNHQRYLDDPALAGSQEGIADGNKILGHILGSKDVSRALAGRAAQQTGVDPALIKQMLPMVATLAMGALSKQRSAAGGDGALQGMLGSLLDADGDGSIADDLLGMAGKLFGR
ncbi:MAG: DUF937 domain-containing protein [Pseudomonadales bacterium]